MANVGQPLTKPEAGWARYDDDSSLFQYSEAFVREYDTSVYKHWKGSAMCCKNGSIGETVKFAFKGTKLRVIGLGAKDFNNQSIIVDGVEYELRCKGGTGDISMMLYFHIDNLENKIHEVTITSIKSSPSDYGYILRFDAIDIDEDGMVFPILTRKYEFPIRIGSEAKVEAYARTLFAGEEQLLITREGNLYLTDGNGGYKPVGGSSEEITIHEHENKAQLDKIGESANMITFNGKVVVNNNEYSFRSLPRAKVVDNYSTSKGGKLPWLI